MGVLNSNFKTVYSKDKTYLNFTLSKREEIDYQQLQMLKDKAYSEYFVEFQYTKNYRTNKICFDISGLTSLSEYLRSQMRQEQYFSIISDIQEIISFCKDRSLAYDNLLCDPKYMYYHITLGKVLMAYVPLNQPHCICGDIPKCLQKIHKRAKSIIITDGNFMNKYEEYLNDLFLASAKGTGVQSFSPDSLLHFFNENGKGKRTKELPEEPPKPKERAKYSIEEQIKEHSAAPERKPAPPSSSAAERTVGPPAADRSGTVVRSRAYLVDSSGKEYPIKSTPFTIGRNMDRMLQIEYMTVSGNHAEIWEVEGQYFIKDYSSNGTYVNERSNRITQQALSNGDKIYFDQVCFEFRTANGAAAPPAPAAAPKSSATVIVGNRSESSSGAADKSDKPLAYIRKEGSGMTFRIMSYPYSAKELPGISINCVNTEGRKTLLIVNIACPFLKLENKDVGMGYTAEIFSGCSLFIQGEQYKFFVEN